MDENRIGKYFLLDSLIHKLNPFYKIISLIILFILLIVGNSFLDILIIGIYVIIILFLTNIDIKIYLKNIFSSGLVLIILFILLLLFTVNISLTVITIIKIIYLILYLAIITFTTPPTEIIYGFEKIFKIFKTVRTTNLALDITMLLRIIPIYISTKEQVMNCLLIKGINYKKRNVNYKIKIIFHTIKLTNTKIKLLKENMLIRLYGYNYSRTNYRLNKWKGTDTLLLIVNIIILIIIIMY